MTAFSKSKLFSSIIFWKAYSLHLCLVFLVLVIFMESAHSILPTLAKNQSKSVTDATVERVMGQAAVFSEELQNTAHFIQSDPVFLSSDRAELEQELEKLTKFSPIVDTVYVFNQRGMTLSSYPNTDGFKHNQDFSTESFFTVPLHTGNTYLSHVNESSTGQPMLFLGIPILDVNHQVQYIVVLGIHLVQNSLVRSFFDQNNIGENGYIYIVDENGSILFHPQKNKIGTSLLNNEVVQELMKQHSGYQKVLNTQGVEMYASYRYIPFLQWGVVAQVPVESTYDAFNTMTSMGRWYLILFIGPLALLVALYTRSIVRPLRILQLAVEEITKGNFDYKLPVRNRSEISELFQRFNEMSKRLKDNQHQLEHIAFHDSLTGLPNRANLERQVQQFILYHPNDKVAIMLLDLDQLKLINDSMGHLAGDQLLQQVAERIKGCLPTGSSISRVGGDEFAILLPCTNTYQDAQNMAKHLLKMFTSAFKIENREFYVSTSIGISIYPVNGTTLETLFKNADIALNQAKSQGKNTYRVFLPDMESSVWKRLEMEESLRKALKENELYLVYQPKMNLQTNQVCGIEALIRWKHPERGIISPDQFIPIAEETELIIPIGEHVLQEACLQMKKWQEAGFPPLRIAVNISVLQLLKPDFVLMIDEILAKTGLDSRWLELEITESTLMENAADVVHVLNTLKQKGIHLSIDDFGTGYSSLSYLKQLPIHSIKVDRSFVRDILVDEGDQMIIRAIISMANSLKLNVIAEGVEETQQIICLRDEGCHEIQGYVISPPIEAKEFERFLMGELALCNW